MLLTWLSALMLARVLMLGSRESALLPRRIVLLRMLAPRPVANATYACGAHVCRAGIESEELRGSHRVVHPVYGTYEGSWSNGLCHDKGRWVPVTVPLNLNTNAQTALPHTHTHTHTHSQSDHM